MPICKKEWLNHIPFIPSGSRTAVACCQQLSLERATHSEASEVGGRLHQEISATRVLWWHASECFCPQRGVTRLMAWVSYRGLCRAMRAWDGFHQSTDHTFSSPPTWCHESSRSLSSFHTFKAFALNERKLQGGRNCLRWCVYCLTWKGPPFLEWDLPERGWVSGAQAKFLWILFLTLQRNLPNKPRGRGSKRHCQQQANKKMKSTHEAYLISHYKDPPVN